MRFGKPVIRAMTILVMGIGIVLLVTNAALTPNFVMGIILALIGVLIIVQSRRQSLPATT